MSDVVRDSTILAYARMAAEDSDLIDRLTADLAQCRALLAALVANGAEYAGPDWVELTVGRDEYNETIAYLAAHPAPEGGQVDDRNA